MRSIQSCGKRTLRGAEGFYKVAHQILHDVEMRAAEKGRLFPGMEGDPKKSSERKENKSRNYHTKL